MNFDVFKDTVEKAVGIEIPNYPPKGEEGLYSLWLTMITGHARERLQMHMDRGVIFGATIGKLEGIIQGHKINEKSLLDYFEYLKGELLKGEVKGVLDYPEWKKDREEIATEEEVDQDEDRGEELVPCDCTASLPMCLCKEPETPPFWIECDCCGKRTGNKGTEAEAVAAWAKMNK